METTLKSPHGFVFGQVMDISALPTRQRDNALDPLILQWTSKVPAGKYAKVQLEKANAGTVVNRFYRLRKDGKINDDYTMSATGNGRKDEVIIKHYQPDDNDTKIASK